MKISAKVLISVSLIILLYALAGFVVLRVFVAQQFVSMERDELRNAFARAENMLGRVIASVSKYGADYARWDDTYAYLSYPNQAYVRSNYTSDAMRSQNIDAVCMTDLDGRVKLNVVNDGKENVDDYSAPGSHLAKLIELGVKDRDTVFSGVIRTARGLMIVTSYPVVDSQMSLPSRGRFFAGRFFDDEEQKLFREMILSDVVFSVIPDSPSSEVTGSAGHKLYIQSDKKSLVLSRTVNDVLGKPAVVMRMNYPRIISDKGFSAVDISTIILVGFGIVVLGGIFFYLKRGVISPLTQLDRRATEIAGSADFTSRLPVAQNDEIGDLARSFNSLLDALSLANATLEQRVFQRTAELERSNRDLVLLGKVFENSSEGILITDSGGTIIKVNPAFSRITGFLPDDVIGVGSDILLSNRHDAAFYSRMHDCVIESGKWSGETWARNKAGRVYPQWSSISLIRSDDGTVMNYMSVFHDISDAKQQESYIRYQAYHDTLTGLPNRGLLLERMTHAIERGAERESRFAILFLDLDHFKNINDSMGHEYGDVLLQHVAERLEKLTRDSDTVARLGGDEFIVMVDDIADLDQPAVLAERIIESFRNPFIVRDQIFHMGTSIGIAVFPDNGDECSTLMRNADTAMYRAKEEGRLRYCRFTDALNERIANKIRLETDLRMAIEANEFLVYYQPKMNLSSGEIEGFEALVRWNNDGKLVSPADFVPLAEETGLILPLDRIVMKRAFVDIRDLNVGRDRPYCVAVNASAKALQHRLFPDEVMMLMKQIGVRPEWVEIEITETEIMKDIDACLDVINRLSGMGLSIALDDFGTGYSSLSQLSRIPVNTLKIDRSFVMTIGEKNNGASIIDNINGLAKGLHLKVVAEGVENRVQMEYLRKIGCDLMQGYHLSKPIPVVELRKFLSFIETSDGRKEFM